MFVRTEYNNKNIKSPSPLVLYPLIHTVCYFLREEAELIWCYFYLKNPQWLPFKSLLASWNSDIVQLFPNIELQPISLQFPNSTFQDQHDTFLLGLFLVLRIILRNCICIKTQPLPTLWEKYWYEIKTPTDLFTTWSFFQNIFEWAP